jgi:4-methyl-5(b-hydroxyethyl)-thiazole monophosphate biosynthesis
MSKNALILIAEGSEEIEAITPAGVDVTVAGVGTLSPMGGHRVPMRAECLLEDVGEILFDALILPGGGKGSENLHKSGLVSSTIMRHWEAGKIVAAICASPAVVLAPLGILSNKHATCYPGLERRFASDVKICDTTVCVEGKLVTSRGPGTAMEFALRLAELLTGAQMMRSVGRALLIPHM